MSHVFKIGQAVKSTANNIRGVIDHFYGEEAYIRSRGLIEVEILSNLVPLEPLEVGDEVKIAFVGVTSTGKVVETGEEVYSVIVAGRTVRFHRIWLEKA